MAADKAGIRSILIVCPSAVKQHWEREFQRWSPVKRSIQIVDGLLKSVPRADVVIASYRAVTKPQHASVLALRHWDALIPDEAHEAKSYGQSQIAKSICGQEAYSLWKHANAVWYMTGTPVVNSAFDMYGYLASSLSRRLERIPSVSEFQQMFTELRMNFRGEMVPKGEKNADILKEVLKPFVLRRESTLDLPLHIGTVPLQISDTDLRPIMANLMGLDPAEYEESFERDDDPNSMQKEAISRVRHALGIAKAKAAAQYITYLVKTVGTGPVVAFYIHREVKNILLQCLKDQNLRSDYIDGSNSHNAQHYQDRHQNGELDVLLVQTRSGGAGLTLTRGNRVVVVEYPWTAVALEQEIKRVHRKTQTRAVTADILFAQDCWLEELEARLIAEKTRTAIAILGKD